MKKNLTSEELILKIEEMRLERPGEKITAASLSRYIQSNGGEMEAYLIRRRPGVTEYMKKCNSELKAEHEQKIAAFRPLDVNAFFSEHSSMTSLRKAIMERDAYYANQAVAANEAFKESKKLKERIEQLKRENERLKGKIQANNKNNTALREKDKVIKKLRAIIDEYINEQMAQMILSKEGILEASTILSDEVFEQHVITPTTDIVEFKNSTVADLWEELNG